MAKRLILIVEDDENIRTELASAFEFIGYPVATAENGQAALARLRSLPELPGLICSDLMMPVLDGQGLVLELQKRPENARFADIPIVIFSAKYHEVYGRVAGYIQKPFSLDQVIELAEKFAGN